MKKKPKANKNPVTDKERFRVIACFKSRNPPMTQEGDLDRRQIVSLATNPKQLMFLQGSNLQFIRQVR